MVPHEEREACEPDVLDREDKHREDRETRRVD